MSNIYLFVLVNNGRVREELETNSIERILELTPINYSGPPVIKVYN